MIRRGRPVALSKIKNRKQKDQGNCVPIALQRVIALSRRTIAA